MLNMTLIGRVASEAKVKTDTKGQPYAILEVTVDRCYRNPDGTRTQDRVPVKIFGSQVKNGSRWEPGWSDTRNNPTCSKQKDGIQKMTNDQKPSIEAKLEGYRQSSSRGGSKTHIKHRNLGTKQREGL